MKNQQFLEVRGAGYTGTDPELRLLPSGTTMVNLRICVNRRWQDHENQWHSDETWISAAFQDELAQDALTIKIGSLIYFEGTLIERQMDRRRTYEVKIRRWHPIGERVTGVETDGYIL